MLKSELVATQYNQKKTGNLNHELPYYASIRLVF